MITKKTEKYITETPALKRKESCRNCKDMFFKHDSDQTECEDCISEVKEQEYEGEQAHEAQVDALEGSSRGVLEN